MLTVHTPLSLEPDAGALDPIGAEATPGLSEVVRGHRALGCCDGSRRQEALKPAVSAERRAAVHLSAEGDDPSAFKGGEFGVDISIAEAVVIRELGLELLLGFDLHGEII